MTLIQPRTADAFLRKPDAHMAVILVYGPDAGLVSERVRSLVESAVDDTADPFQLVRLDGDEIASDPGRLAEEAFTIPLFGGRRAVRVRAGSRNLVPAVEPLLATTLENCRVVIEGGDWKKSHALVSQLERSRVAAVLPCYGDTGRSVEEIVAEEVALAGLAIAPDAREALVELLGGDRLATRGEIQKLTLYAHGAGRIELADVNAVVGDASLLVTDEVIDGTFSGEVDTLDRLLGKAWAEGVNAAVIAGSALRHALLLHRLRAEVEKGQAAASVVAGAGYAVHFSRKAAVTRQIATLPLDRLGRIVADLQACVLETRRSAALADTLVSRAFMRIALMARPRGR